MSSPGRGRVTSPRGGGGGGNGDEDGDGTKRFKMRADCKSIAWMHFRRVLEKDAKGQDKRYAVCYVVPPGKSQPCMAHLTYHNSTSSLLTHLKTRHPEVFENKNKASIPLAELASNHAPYVTSAPSVVPAVSGASPSSADRPSGAASVKRTAPPSPRKAGKKRVAVDGQTEGDVQMGDAFGTGETPAGPAGVFGVGGYWPGPGGPMMPYLPGHQMQPEETRVAYPQIQVEPETGLLAQFLSANYLSSGVVELPPFRRFVQAISNSYEPPTAEFVEQAVMPQLKRKVLHQLRQYTGQETQPVCIAVDFWTSVDGFRRYAEISGHWLDNDFTPVNALLDVYEITNLTMNLDAEGGGASSSSSSSSSSASAGGGPTSSSTAPSEAEVQAAADMLKEVLQVFFINPNRLVSVTSDGSWPAVVAACTELGVPHLPCLGRGLQRALDSALSTMEGPRKALECARRLNTLFSVSTFHRELLRQRQLQENQHHLQEMTEEERDAFIAVNRAGMVTEVQGRWWTTLTMLENLVQRQPLIDSVMLSLASVSGSSGCSKVLQRREWLEVCLLLRFFLLLKETANALSHLSFPTWGMGVWALARLDSALRHEEGAARDALQSGENLVEGCVQFGPQPTVFPPDVVPPPEHLPLPSFFPTEAVQWYADLCGLLRQGLANIWQLPLSPTRPAGVAGPDTSAEGGEGTLPWIAMHAVSLDSRIGSFTWMPQEVAARLLPPGSKDDKDSIGTLHRLVGAHATETAALLAQSLAQWDPAVGCVRVQSGGKGESEDKHGDADGGDFKKDGDAKSDGGSVASREFMASLSVARGKSGFGGVESLVGVPVGGIDRGVSLQRLVSGGGESAYGMGRQVSYSVHAEPPLPQMSSSFAPLSRDISGAPGGFGQGANGGPGNGGMGYGGFMSSPMSGPMQGGMGGSGRGDSSFVFTPLAPSISLFGSSGAEGGEDGNGQSGEPRFASLHEPLPPPAGENGPQQPNGTRPTSPSRAKTSPKRQPQQQQQRSESGWLQFPSDPQQQQPMAPAAAAPPFANAPELRQPPPTLPPDAMPFQPQSQAPSFGFNGSSGAAAAAGAASNGGESLHQSVEREWNVFDSICSHGAEMDMGAREMPQNAWSEDRRSLPYLTKLARAVLAIPALCRPTLMLYGSCGGVADFLADERARLSVDDARVQVFLHTNVMHGFGFSGA
uniref:BED-type domain-containing protein n=1 Tax=Chromera velia CCMP2878 TaxID=1169474 RepID=A0A0G4GRB2_9ALVE|eukprot:Cvel_23025.t1-p1 / transcript=Cvel_23025.t1 / gene=Cvel_23025 / organism=Chromera_velia_CCMP2878 / gene_product=hypothetical protein / transcript_product=hypothetical protein / location=Cvel_scaffold2326:5990-10885(+) / protein_length=1187 / sequence_SO=supercontig / SO=protein_coding / is_pseudo=false